MVYVCASERLEIRTKIEKKRRIEAYHFAHIQRKSVRVSEGETMMKIPWRMASFCTVSHSCWYNDGIVVFAHCDQKEEISNLIKWNVLCVSVCLYVTCACVCGRLHKCIKEQHFQSIEIVHTFTLSRYNFIYALTIYRPTHIIAPYFFHTYRHYCTLQRSVWIRKHVLLITFFL